MRLVFSVACLATATVSSAFAYDRDGQSDRLYYHRAQIQALSTQLELNTNQFVEGATALALNNDSRDGRYGPDKWRGRNRGNRNRQLGIDPSQQFALQTATQLQLAVRTFTQYQTNLSNCGPYERNRGMCDSTIFTEISLFRQVRESFETLQSQAFNLSLMRTGQGQFALQQISSTLMNLKQIYRNLQGSPRTTAPSPVPPPPPYNGYPSPYQPGAHRAVPVNPSQVPPAPQPGYGNSRF